MKNLFCLRSLCVFVALFFAQSFASAQLCERLQKMRWPANVEKKLELFYDVTWKFGMEKYPEWATYVGEPGHNADWTDQSPETLAKDEKEPPCGLDFLKKIPAQTLKGEARISYELALRSYQEAFDGKPFGAIYLAIDQMGGLHQSLVGLMMAAPKNNARDYEDMLSRLEKFPVVEKNYQSLLAVGVKKKIIAVKMFLEKVPAQIDALLPTEIEKSPIFQPFIEMNSSLTPEQKKNFQDRARKLIQEKVYPALKSLREFLIKDYIPFARTEIAVTSLPKGKEWYAFMVRSHTTTNKTPEELHQLGLDEVARLENAMGSIREKLKYKEATAFHKYLLSDAQFFYKNPNDLVAGYRDVAKRMDAELPRLFKDLPRLPYGVREMPEYMAKEAPTAYYEGGSLEAGRAGYFTANTYDLKSRPRWGMEALTFHEAVPGHHLQIGLAQELRGLPMFRTQGGYTAYVEGWGLYAESLGEELGFYKDVYSKYGQLSYEMWRAIRLVVDTGMHSKGWTRQQAIDYMLARMPKSRIETEAEIDRYITWPGQALGYKVGQLKFKEWREKALAALKEKFDVREFHAEVLRHGPLPLDVLDQVMERWLKAQLKTKPPAKAATK